MASEPAELAVWLDVLENYPEARAWVAHNQTVPLEVLSILAGDPSQRVRFMVSMKWKLPPDILARLAADPDDSVRLRVARRRNTHEPSSKNSPMISGPPSPRPQPNASKPLGRADVAAASQTAPCKECLVT